MVKKPSKKTRSKRSTFAKWIWENQVKPIVRMQAGNRCAICKVDGTYKQLHCHHLNGRQNIYMLTYLPNIMLLCATHHTLSNDQAAHSQTKDGRDAFDSWLESYLGKDNIEKLSYLRRNSPKLSLQDLEDLYESYKKMLDEC